jgi:succinate dehydrogenase/fumarate reductase flavoprotein subunit
MDQTRRQFLTTAATGTVAGIAATYMLTPATNASAEELEKERVTEELPITDTYEYDRLDQTDYQVDVLVIGCGYAGLNAAYAAKQAGKDVLVVDKGRPGYSGQSPWPGTFNFIDPELGDDTTAFRENMRYTSEYTGNLDWIDAWIADSAAMEKRISGWGILDQYPQMFKTEYWETRDYYGYRDNVVGDHERRTKFVKVLDDNGIPWLQHVMMTNLIVQDGRCVGAMGFQFTTGDIVSVSAKAVVCAAGNGCVTPIGHPLGDNSFDGEYMCYQLGLPIGGKEYEDFHTHQSFAAGNHWVGSDSRFFDPDFLCGGATTVADVSRSKYKCDNEITKEPTNPDGLAYFDVQPQSTEIPTKSGATSINYGINPDDPRSGKLITPYVTFDAPGAAPGMCLHLASGVWCGFGDTQGKTDVAGLYVAGDGMDMIAPDGGNYATGNGFTSCFCSINGDHAGAAAAEYADTVELETITQDNYDAVVAEIEQPLTLETGFSPEWGRDVLQGIMAPYWVLKNKTEETLNAALTQVVYMRDHCADKFLARNGHQLRLCHEMKHKLNACELKLRAALYRKESRGANFYRDDYPDRDDDHFRGFILQTKDPDSDTPKIEFVEAKAEWGKDGIPSDYEVPDYDPSTDEKAK